MRFKLTIEYAGSRYSGWQIQKNARTVQGELARAVREATGRSRFELYGSGRTDAGVHALRQTAHLEVTARGPVDEMRRAINDLLREPSSVPPRLAAPASGLFLERVYYPGEPRPKLTGAAWPVARTDGAT